MKNPVKCSSYRKEFTRFMATEVAAPMGTGAIQGID
jgi:hypothetical protein